MYIVINNNEISRVEHIGNILEPRLYLVTFNRKDTINIPFDFTVRVCGIFENQTLYYQKLDPSSYVPLDVAERLLQGERPTMEEYDSMLLESKGGDDKWKTQEIISYSSEKSVIASEERLLNKKTQEITCERLKYSSISCQKKEKKSLVKKSKKKRTQGGTNFSNLHFTLEDRQRELYGN